MLRIWPILIDFGELLFEFKALFIELEDLFIKFDVNVLENKIQRMGKLVYFFVQTFEVL